MDLVARYVAAVQRELPEDKRDEIGRELNANILDQLDALREQHGALTETQITDLLKAMGRPRDVAQQFVPPQPLIRLSYIPLYQCTLFMVLGILFLFQILDTTVTWLSSADMGLVRYLLHLAGGFLEHAIFGFATMTVVFWLLSREGIDVRTGCERNWNPAELPEAGPDWQHIDLQDIFTDMGTYLFLLIVIWYPVFMSAEQLDPARYIVSDQAHHYLKWASPLAIVGIGMSLWQLRLRLWSRRMLASNIVVNIAWILTVLSLAASTPLIHSEASLLQGAFNYAQLERSATFLLIVIALYPAWEITRDVRRLGRQKVDSPR